MCDSDIDGRKREIVVLLAKLVNLADCQGEATGGTGGIWRALDCVGTCGESADDS